MIYGPNGWMILGMEDSAMKIRKFILLMLRVLKYAFFVDVILVKTKITIPLFKCIKYAANCLANHKKTRF